MAGFEHKIIILLSLFVLIKLISVFLLSKNHVASISFPTYSDSLTLVFSCCLFPSPWYPTHHLAILFLHKVTQTPMLIETSRKAEGMVYSETLVGAVPLSAKYLHQPGLNL
jgi:hypothetical protein